MNLNIHTGLMDEVLKCIFEYLVMGQLKFGMEENRFIIENDSLEI